MQGIKKLHYVVSMVSLMSFLLFSSAEAQQTHFTQEKVKAIETYIKDGMEQLNLPGLSLGIIESGKPVLMKGYGMSNNQGTSVNAQTPFKLGSLTKSFTALAIMQLFGEGKLNINEPVTNTIPWFTTKNKLNSGKILVKHLLNHTSGFSTISGLRNQDSTDNSSSAIKNSIQELSEISLTSTPGEQYQYSNVNYQILGYLLEVLEKNSYENIIQQRIFEPLKMQNSSAYRQPKNAEAITQGYYFDSDKPVAFIEDVARSTIAQGGIYASAEDIVLYLNDLLKDKSAIVSADNKQRILSIDDQERGYGFGWFISQKEKFKLVFHFGTSYGYQSVAMFSPELNLGFVVLANASNGFGHHNVRALLRGVGDIVLGFPPAELNPPLIENIIFWSVYIVPALILICAFFFIKGFRNGNKLPLKRPFSTFEIIKRLIFPSVVLLGIAYILLLALPEFYGVLLNVISQYEPTLFFGVMLCSSSALIWFMLRSVFLLRK